MPTARTDSLIAKKPNLAALMRRTQFAYANQYVLDAVSTQLLGTIEALREPQAGPQEDIQAIHRQAERIERCCALVQAAPVLLARHDAQGLRALLHAASRAPGACVAILKAAMDAGFAPGALWPLGKGRVRLVTPLEHAWLMGVYHHAGQARGQAALRALLEAGMAPGLRAPSRGCVLQQAIGCHVFQAPQAYRASDAVLGPMEHHARVAAILIEAGAPLVPEECHLEYFNLADGLKYRVTPVLLQLCRLGPRTWSKAARHVEPVAQAVLARAASPDGDEYCGHTFEHLPARVRFARPLRICLLGGNMAMAHRLIEEGASLEVALADASRVGKQDQIKPAVLTEARAMVAARAARLAGKAAIAGMPASPSQAGSQVDASALPPRSVLL